MPTITKQILLRVPWRTGGIVSRHLLRADAGKDVVLCMARCPDPNCSAPAEVYAEAIHSSTGGPVPHARTVCLNRHFYQLPVEYIPGMPAR
jgi:hypothetical protein